MPKALSEAAKLGGQEILLKGAAGKGSVQGFVTQEVTGNGETAATITITEAAKPVEQSTEAPAPEAPAETAEPALTAEAVQQMLAQALTPIQQAAAQKDEAIAAKDAEVEALRQQLQASEAEKQQAQQDAEAQAAEATARQQELEEAKQAQNAMENLGKLVGDVKPAAQGQQIEVLGVGSPAMRNWEQMLKNAPSKPVMYKGMGFQQKDKRGAADYFWKNIAEIRGGMEAVAKDAGLLQGAFVTNAATDKDCIPSSLFDYLVNFVRQVTDCDLIYEQFARRVPVPGTAPRCQGNIPRYPYSEGPSTKDARKLDCNTPINAARKGIKETLVKFDICEYGLGKDEDNAALAVSECVMAYSMQNLEDIVARNLGRDYQRFVDMLVRCEFFGSNTVLYNNNNCVTADPTAIEPGAITTMSRGFLRALWAFNRTNKKPTYANGHYVLVLNPNQIQYLLDELAINQRYVEPATPQDLELISRILQLNESERFGGRVGGFKMMLDGFMIFETNVHSTGAAGTEGVQLENFGTDTPTAAETETAFSFGPDAVGWATALPVEIREGEINDFNRCKSWIWYSHEAFFPIDVNEAFDPANPTLQTQECRVVQLRLARKPF